MVHLSQFPGSLAIKNAILFLKREKFTLSYGEVVNLSLTKALLASFYG